MSEFRIKLLDKNSRTLASSGNGDSVSIVYSAFYNEGDEILLETDKAGVFCVFQPDDALQPSLIYCKSNICKYKIPFGKDKIVFSPKAFFGDRHLIRARAATADEVASYRNIALNTADRHGDNGYFPHASANVETRGEAVFAAYNAIDGVFENASHGEWPYESWGINRDPKAELTIDFGREVEVDAAALTLRADFPHDSYWTSAALTFSDGSEEVFSLVKSAKPQKFTFAKRKITWVKLSRLIKAQDESPFPALTQIEVFGV